MYLIYNYSYEAMEVHSPGTFWHSKFSLPADHNIHSSLWSTERNLTQNHLKIYARFGVNEEDTLVISGPSKGNIRVLSGKPMKKSQSLRPTARHILSQTLEVTVKQIYDLILTFTDSSTAWSVTTCPTYLSERCRLPCHCRTGHLLWLDISESLPAMTTIASQGSLECSCAIEMQHFRPKTWQSSDYKITKSSRNIKTIREISSTSHCSWLHSKLFLDHCSEAHTCTTLSARTNDRWFCFTQIWCQKQFSLQSRGAKFSQTNRPNIEVYQYTNIIQYTNLIQYTMVYSTSHTSPGNLLPHLPRTRAQGGQCCSSNRQRCRLTVHCLEFRLTN